MATMSFPGPRASHLLSRRTLRVFSRAISENPLPRPIHVCAAQRCLSTEALRELKADSESEEDRPRWSYTPPAMKGKFRLNPINDIRRTEWTVNEDPKKLDQMYHRFLGRDGATMLSEEIKWLAVTHKSFDQGRRGFNDRLAYFGRNIIIQEAAQYILTVEPSEPPPDRYGREPFRHPALDRTNNFHKVQAQDLLDKSKIARLGVEMGVNHVMRWKPRLPENLSGSGIEIVINQVMFAIIGAVAMQKGMAAATKIVRDKILRRTHAGS